MRRKVATSGDVDEKVDLGVNSIAYRDVERVIPHTHLSLKTEKNENNKKEDRNENKKLTTKTII